MQMLHGKAVPLNSVAGERSEGAGRLTGLNSAASEHSAPSEGWLFRSLCSSRQRMKLGRATGG